MAWKLKSQCENKIARRNFDFYLFGFNKWKQFNNLTIVHIWILSRKQWN